MSEDDVAASTKGFSQSAMRAVMVCLMEAKVFSPAVAKSMRAATQ